jgi:hypothetical protein
VAFAPDVAITFSTQAPKATPAIVAKVTPVSGQTAVSSVSLAFPKAFGFNEQFRPARCQPMAEAARACPDSSRIGSVEAESLLGPGTGSVYLTQDFRLVAFASALAGAIQITAGGTISIGPDGGFAVDFTKLPNLPLNSITLSLDGGKGALLKNPRRCRIYRLPTRAVSHNGEVSESVVQAPVTGCATPSR